jgi:Arc/MetJ-type ribon-helix-helix transcriptional regulator
MGHHTVYSGATGRTQIYLGDDELELLDRVARATGASRSELVRRAVRNTFGEKTKAERLRALEASAGTFRGRRMTGADYVDALRGDLDERLNRQGLG